jgi:hypothetical protein
MSQLPLKTHDSETSRRVDVIPNHPLADIVGTFEGEFWDETLEQIKQARERDHQEQEQITEASGSVS